MEFRSLSYPAYLKVEPRIQLDSGPLPPVAYPGARWSAHNENSLSKAIEDAAHD